ncbi:hypothetical protein D3C85_1825600 [compost metagenome]
MSLLNDIVAYTSKKEFFDTTKSSAAHNNQISATLFCVFQNGCYGDTWFNNNFDMF